MAFSEPVHNQFANLLVAGTINETAKTIALSLPYGTAITALVASFTTTGSSVKVGSTAQVSGTTANGFSFETRTSLAALSMLTPGDFKAVLSRVRFHTGGSARISRHRA